MKTSPESSRAPYRRRAAASILIGVCGSDLAVAAGCESRQAAEGMLDYPGF
jgi:hypothetical protein